MTAEVEAPVTRRELLGFSKGTKRQAIHDRPTILLTIQSANIPNHRLRSSPSRGRAWLARWSLARITAKRAIADRAACSGAKRSSRAAIPAWDGLRRSRSPGRRRCGDQLSARRGTRRARSHRVDWKPRGASVLPCPAIFAAKRSASSWSPTRCAVWGVWTSS